MELNWDSLGPQICNSLPEHMKAETYLHILEVWLILGLVKNAFATCVGIPEHSILLTTK